MKNLHYFLQALSAEQIRLKHSWLWKLSVLAPVFVCIMYFCIFYFRGEHYMKEGTPAWNVYTDSMPHTVFMLFLPLFIILFSLLNQQLDHQANIRKLLYTLPVPRWAQLGAQGLNALMIYTASIVLYLLLLMLSGWLLSLLRPELGFTGFISHTYLLALFKGFLASLSMLSLQFLLSYFFRNMIVPLCIGLSGYVSAMVLLRWEHVVYHPFVYQMFAFMEVHGEQAKQLFSQPVSLALGLSALLLLTGYLFRKRVDLL